MAKETPAVIFHKSIFVDSGAHSIYNLEVLKHSKENRKSRLARKPLLDKPPVKWGQGDFSYYSLEKGSPFRKYCDAYAAYITEKTAEAEKLGKQLIFATVDAIGSPSKTWEIQRYFEDEHGVQPVPIVHYDTPMSFVDRYLEADRYYLLGVGGLGQGVSQQQYDKWGDKFFLHICPASNKRMPLIRTHGFAMTSWRLICKWPWWSVDSATWVKLSAYGWLYVPPWLEREQRFQFDRPPLMINFSIRPPKRALQVLEETDGLMARTRGVSPREMEVGKHYNQISPTGTWRVSADKWLEYLGLEMGSMKDGVMDKFGVCSHHRARSIANLHYLKLLERSRPKWPHPLDNRIVSATEVNYGKGLGL